MSESHLPSAVRRAAARFKAKRADYYGYMASIMKSSRGEAKLLTMFEKDAQRYAGQPRGVLAAYWVEALSNNGSNLAAAWQGCFPDDEVSIVRVAQDAGGNALEVALADLARVASLTDRIRKEVLSTLAAALVGIIVAAVMLTLFPIFSVGKLQEIYSFIPVDQWGATGTKFKNYAEGVESYGLYVIFALVLLLAWIQWSINNWVGPGRDWADRKIVLYRAIRDVKGAMFLATMSTLTRKRGNVMFTLLDSLSLFASSLQSVWMRWRVEEIVDRVSQTGAGGSDVFNTNLLDREMFFFLADAQEARGFADGFEETGRHVETHVVAALIKRMAIYRWAMLLLAVLAVIGVMGWQFSVINEMRGVMQNYYSSR